jgi:hypothetical protein
MIFSVVNVGVDTRIKCVQMLRNINLPRFIVCGYCILLETAWFGTIYGDLGL